jgi:hypothetical protein
MAIATGERLHEPQVVQRELAARGLEFETITVPNDIRLREVVSFMPLLEMVRSTASEEATLYGHTKGNSTANSKEGSRLWSEAMYANLLDRPEVVSEGLISRAAVGCCKICWRPDQRSPYPTKLTVGQWMFAGTFFWFRHDVVFQDPRWSTVADDRYGAEAWLSSLLAKEDGLSIYQPWPEDQYPTPSPYKPEVHRRVAAIHT